MKTVYVVIRVDNVDSTVGDPVTLEAFETKEEAKTYVLADMNMFVDEAKEMKAYACTQRHEVSRCRNVDNDMLAMFGEA